MHLTLQQLFGARAYQDSDHLVINKGDLSLSAKATNTAESLLAAIVVNAVRQFEGVIQDEVNQSITDENNVPITFSNSKLYELLNIFYWKRQCILFQQQSYILDTFVLEINEIQ